MQRKTIARIKTTAANTNNYSKNILPNKAQSKIKGGANPWTDGP